MNRGICIINALDATNPPRAREPVSPINTFAGYTLNSRKPSRLPTTAPVMGLMPVFSPMATTVMKVATRIVTLVHRPSRPSVKFTPLSVPRVTKKRKGTNSHPRSRKYPWSKPPVKGMSMDVPTSLEVIRYQQKIPVITNCPSSFCLGFSPSDRFITILM